MPAPILIEKQCLLYHLTCLNNIPNILSSGLQSRSSLGNNFVDVADDNIIEGRTVLELEKMVPFHFFTNNPFDGRVKTDHFDKEFCVISVSRDFAKDNGWKIIPRHPLAVVQGLEILDYDEGFNTIDWDLMNRRDYKDPESKSVCMAECLSLTTVHAKDFHAFYVKSEKTKKYVEGLLKEHNLTTFVNVNQHMC